jgi:type IV pilus assembly protein PilA
MSARTRRRPADESGFTLVELLVVMVIIGILASVGIAAFLSQRTKAQDGQAKVYVVTASKALAVWQTEHDTFAGADVAALARIEPSLATAPGLTLGGLGTGTYSLSVDSASGTAGGGTFTITRLATGESTRTCSNPGSGSCLATADGQGNLW